MKKLSTLLALILVSTCATSQSAQAVSGERWTVSKTMVMDAPVDKVWQISKSLRLSDTPAHHVMSHAGSVVHVQEKFDVPVLGAVSCVYAEQENEPRTVQYHLVSSSNFTAFEGSWQFVPVSSKQTAVTLTSYADTGSLIPFASRMTRKQITQSVDQRMNDLRVAIERRTIASLPGS